MDMHEPCDERFGSVHDVFVRKIASVRTTNLVVMRRLIAGLLIGGCLVAGSVQTQAQDLQAAAPESVGLSPEGLAEATRGLRAHVDAGDIAGVVAAVARNGRLVYLEALGELDRERGLAMRDDALFRLYSMTRPITSLAAMILWEEGRFELDDPVARYLPEFADQRVFTDAMGWTPPLNGIAMCQGGCVVNATT